MVVTAVCFAVAVLSLLLVLRTIRIRDQRELDQHSITAEELYSLLTSNQDILLLDVRQPLDLLAYPEIIPGAHWISPKEVLEKPSLIPKEKEVAVYCTCAGEKTSRAVLHRALAMHFTRIKLCLPKMSSRANGPRINNIQVLRETARSVMKTPHVTLLREAWGNL